MTVEDPDRFWEYRAMKKIGKVTNDVLRFAARMGGRPLFVFACGGLVVAYWIVPVLPILIVRAQTRPSK